MFYGVNWLIGTNSRLLS